MQTFRCSPAGVSTPSAGGVRGRRQLGGARRVDIHCHVHTEAAAELAAGVFSPDKEPALAYATASSNEVNRKQMAELDAKLTRLAERFADMDRMDVDVQAISPSPFQYYYYTEPELGRTLARCVNDNLATLAAEHPERFVAMGTVPLQEPRLAVEELERCVGELGMRGVEISSQVNGVELTRAGLDAFFAKTEELGVMLFLHPLGFTQGDRLTEHYFNNIIGNPLESTLAVSHLIFDGVFERHPDLKLCVAHGGGFLPTYAGRMDHAHAVRPDCRERIQSAPSAYLKKIFFDTVVFDPEHIAYLVQRYGAEHLLLGTDYPYDMGEGDPVALVGAAGLSDSERAAIEGGNATRLLGLDTRVS